MHNNYNSYLFQNSVIPKEKGDVKNMPTNDGLQDEMEGKDKGGQETGPQDKEGEKSKYV